jgi:hypothetical protein
MFGMPKRSMASAISLILMKNRFLILGFRSQEDKLRSNELFIGLGDQLDDDRRLVHMKQSRCPIAGALTRVKLR